MTRRVRSRPWRSSRAASSPCSRSLAYPDQATVTPYLAIPALIAAVDRGRAGLLRVLATEFVAARGGLGCS